MKLVDLVRLAISNLKENPLRTTLCALSVAVGTGALLMIAVVGICGKTQVDKTLQTLGVSGLTVYLDQYSTGNPLSAELVNQMEKKIADVRCAMPIKAKTGTVRAGHTIHNTVFLGVDERLGTVMQLQVLYGSLLTKSQAGLGKSVAVVGDDLARALYGRTNIIGRSIRVRIEGYDRDFTVCGVVKAQTSALGGAVSAIAPYLVYIPYSYLASPQENADQVFVQCTADTSLSAVGDQISGYLTNRAQVGGSVQVQNMSGMIDTVTELTNTGILLFFAIGGITLCVALIGVLCSMLAATYEKTEEIGVLLALGAQPRDIRHLFLIQSSILCAFGGLCGIGAVGSLLMYGVSYLIPDWRLILALLGISVICGAAAGLMPAIRAAKLDPIRAIHK